MPLSGPTKLLAPFVVVDDVMGFEGAKAPTELKVTNVNRLAAVVNFILIGV
jgi:hypothetical protein